MLRRPSISAWFPAAPALLLALAVNAGPAAAASPMMYAGQWGSFGQAASQFTSPNGIAVDDAGFVYVTDYLNNNVQKFTSSGALVRQWGIGGTQPGKLNAPYGIAVDHSFRVFVVEYGNSRVSRFDSSGVFQATWGSVGVADGKFTNPTGVTVDDSGNVYVSEPRRIQKFTYTGTFLGKWGGSGTGDGQFNNSNGLASRGARIYVADTGNNRVQEFSSMGAFLGKWGASGTGDGQFTQPSGVCVDRSGNVYVADTDNNRVQKFTSGGTYLGQWGATGAGDGQFSFPFGVCARRDVDEVHVADTFNYRVQHFVPNSAVGVGGPGASAVRLWCGSNPARGEARVWFSLAQAGPARVAVQDAAGRRVREMFSGRMDAGRHPLVWDLRSEGGEPVRAGAYFVRLETPGGSASLKLTVVR